MTCSRFHKKGRNREINMIHTSQFECVSRRIFMRRGIVCVTMALIVCDRKIMEKTSPNYSKGGAPPGGGGQGTTPSADPTAPAQVPQMKDLNETPGGLPDLATTPVGWGDWGT